jgi:hypothetical protein
MQNRVKNNNFNNKFNKIMGINLSKKCQEHINLK